MVDTESVEAVQARHKKELKALDGTGRRLVKQANKNKAKLGEAEAKIAQMDQDTKERHRRELDEASSQASTKASASTGEDSATPSVSAGDGSGIGKGEGGSDGGDAGATVRKKGEVSGGSGGMSVADRERATRDQKRAKAQRKREKQREKELEREQRIEKEKEEGGPDPRLIEMEALRTQLAPRGFRVREIKADGHCLYRAVAEQLRLTGRRPELSEESYPLMREEAARQLRSSPSDYLPFLEDVEEGEGFERYCVSVQGSAEWGGQVELQALSKALEVPMQVFSAMSPPLVLGDEYDGARLLLTYHEHYYALGAHYNSVAPS